MKIIQATSFSIDSLTATEAASPRARRGEIVVRVNAVSLNYRDLAVLSGSYMPGLALPYVPASDACGTVEAIGEDVTRFKVGDRVVPCYIRGWHDGALTLAQRSHGTLGGPLPGVLQELIVIAAEDAVAAPPHLSDAEASTLPIAALTAWSCLMSGGIKAGDNVLVQGTGGVALFALQFARAAGARVVALTSGPEKAALLERMGAAAVINYRQTPQWADAVRAATGGAGADIIVETSGSSLAQSLAAVAFGGFVGVVGFVAGMEAPLNIRQLIGPMVRVQGIVVGSRAGLTAMSRAMALHNIKPLVDSTWTMAQTREAFLRLKSGAHSGKVVIAL